MGSFQNLHLEDRPLFVNYKSLFPTNMVGAHQILEDAQLDNKVFNAAEFNDIITNIRNAQLTYYNNVPVRLNTYLSDFNDDILKLGYVGEYNSSSSYYGYNIVSYNSNLYFCKVDPKQVIQNIVPTNDKYWFYLGLRGSQGYSGLGIVLRYEWNSSTAYSAKDVVSYNNYLYVAKQSSTNKKPNTETAYWELLMDYQISKITIDESEANVSDIYIEEL